MYKAAKNAQSGLATPTLTANYQKIWYKTNSIC